MNLTAATVTIYFIGLVNFQADGGGYEVIAPMATTPVEYNGKKLDAHQATIAITSTSGCGALGSCTIPVATTGKIVEVVSPTGPLTTTARFQAIPKLTRFCSLRVDDAFRRDPRKYAVRMTIGNGELDACRNGDAWISRLTVKSDDPDTVGLKIGGVAVTLNDGAVVRIFNTPVAHGGDEDRHFWWYYVMHASDGKCSGRPGSPGKNCPVVPPATTAAACPCDGGVAVPPAAAQGGHKPAPAASGAGCSNTQYP